MNDSVGVRRRCQPLLGGDEVGHGLCDIHEMLWIPEGGGGAWLGDQRVLLFYPSSYQALVRALMEDASPEAAQRAIMRMGYTAGTNSAALLLSRGEGKVDAESFARALSMLTMVGVAQAGQVDVELDAARGLFQAQISWTQSLDADFYLSNLGLSAAPVCHSLIGYANAYASALMGVPVAFREVECQACGHEVCRAVGRTVVAWGARPQSLSTRVRTRSSIASLAGAGLRVPAMPRTWWVRRRVSRLLSNLSNGWHPRQ